MTGLLTLWKWALVAVMVAGGLWGAVLLAFMSLVNGFADPLPGDPTPANALAYSVAALIYLAATLVGAWALPNHPGRAAILLAALPFIAGFLMAAALRLWPGQMPVTVQGAAQAAAWVGFPNLVAAALVQDQAALAGMTS